jgi:Helix-turn-helix domain
MEQDAQVSLKKETHSRRLNTTVAIGRDIAPTGSDLQSLGDQLSKVASPSLNPSSETSGGEPALIENSIDNKTSYVTSDELAVILNVTGHAIRKWRQQGRIKPYQFGRSVRYVVDEVVATLTRRGQKYEKQRRKI